jgi:hypothetical protein
MSLQQALLMVGSTVATVTIGNQTITSYGWQETNPTPPPANINHPAISSYLLNADGTSSWEGVDNVGDPTSGTFSGEWLSGGTTSAYEAQIVATGTGTMSGSTTGSGVWNALGTNRKWTVTQTYLSLPLTKTLAVTIRRISDSVTMDTATITLQGSL